MFFHHGYKTLVYSADYNVFYNNLIQKKDSFRYFKTPRRPFRVQYIILIVEKIYLPSPTQILYSRRCKSYQLCEIFKVFSKHPLKAEEKIVRKPSFTIVFKTCFFRASIFNFYFHFCQPSEGTNNQRTLTTNHGCTENWAGSPVACDSCHCLGHTDSWQDPCCH